MEEYVISSGTTHFDIISSPELKAQKIIENTDIDSPLTLKYCTVERPPYAHYVSYHRCEQHELIKLIWE